MLEENEFEIVGKYYSLILSSPLLVSRVPICTHLYETQTIPNQSVLSV